MKTLKEFRESIFEAGDWGSMSHRSFKHAELSHELGGEGRGEMSDHTIHINGKPWKTFVSHRQAHAAARTIQNKNPNKKVEVHSRTWYEY